jgi:hypothetical protein
LPSDGIVLTPASVIIHLTSAQDKRSSAEILYLSRSLFRPQNAVKFTQPRL